MISVIVPTYNEEESIASCLESLCNQTIPRGAYEIIVVDGNSKDRTREIAAKYADPDFVQRGKRSAGRQTPCRGGYGRRPHQQPMIPVSAAGAFNSSLVS